jgi:hypothetical protein
MAYNNRTVISRPPTMRVYQPATAKRSLFMLNSSAQRLLFQNKEEHVVFCESSDGRLMIYPLSDFNTTTFKKIKGVASVSAGGQKISCGKIAEQYTNGTILFFKWNDSYECLEQIGIDAPLPTKEHQ